MGVILQVKYEYTIIKSYLSTSFRVKLNETYNTNVIWKELIFELAVLVLTPKQQ
jgi:hypothetical protein